jgi:hypothetical protein
MAASQPGRALSLARKLWHVRRMFAPVLRALVRPASCFLTAAFLVAVAVAGGRALAQPIDDASEPAGQPVSAERSASVGAFSPWSMSARSDTQAGIVHVRGGYDSGRGRALFDTQTEARLTGRVSVRAGFSWLENTAGGGPQLGLKLDVLRQEKHGADFAVAASYDNQGFNLVPSAVVAAAVARSFRNTRVLATVAYGQGLRQDERYADVSVAALRPVAAGVQLGLDSRLRFDLERDADEPPGEAGWDLVAGPSAVVALGRFALTTTAGMSALSLRAGGPAKVGALVLTGLGSAF